MNNKICESHNADMHMDDANENENAIAVVKTLDIEYVKTYVNPTQLWMMKLKNMLYKHKHLH